MIFMAKVKLRVYMYVINKIYIVTLIRRSGFEINCIQFIIINHIKIIAYILHIFHAFHD